MSGVNLVRSLMVETFASPIPKWPQHQLQGVNKVVGQLVEWGGMVYACSYHIWGWPITEPAIIDGFSGYIEVWPSLTSCQYTAPYRRRSLYALDGSISQFDNFTHVAQGLMEPMSCHLTFSDGAWVRILGIRGDRYVDALKLLKRHCDCTQVASLPST